MYHLTPFRYLLEGFLALLVQGQEIRCETNELAIFPPHLAKTVRRMPVNSRSKRGVMSKPSQTVLVDSVSTQRATPSQLRSTSSQSPSGAILALCGPTSSSILQSSSSALGFTWAACARSSHSSAQRRANKRRRRRRSRRHRAATQLEAEKKENSAQCAATWLACRCEDAGSGKLLACPRPERARLG
jgi:hypothetical protein